MKFIYLTAFAFISRLKEKAFCRDDVHQPLLEKSLKNVIYHYTTGYLCDIFYMARNTVLGNDLTVLRC